MRFVILLCIVSVVLGAPSPDPNPAPGDVLGFLRGIIQKFVPGNRPTPTLAHTHTHAHAHTRPRVVVPYQHHAPQTPPPTPLGLVIVKN